MMLVPLKGNYSLKEFNKTMDIVPCLCFPYSCKDLLQLLELSPHLERPDQTKLHYIVGRNDTFYHAVRSSVSSSCKNQAGRLSAIWGGNCQRETVDFMNKWVDKPLRCLMRAPFSRGPQLYHKAWLARLSAS